MNAIAIAPFVVCSTLLGGLFALRLRDRLHLILGFSAGAVVGVALFDLLPEAFRLAQANDLVGWTPAFVGAGFLLYLMLDRLAVPSLTGHHGDAPGHAQHTARGRLGATSLVVHSAFDGIAIGLAFQVSDAIGIGVAAAVIAHDFSDGINTTNVILKNEGTRKAALGWLLADAAAPAVGIGSTLLFHLQQQVFALVLAVLSGFFLYLGASDLVPESQHAHPKYPTTLATLLGAAVIYLAVSYAG